MCAVKLRTGLAAVLLLTATASFAVALGTASGATARPLLPARVYAPYFETWRPAGIILVARQSGVRFFTLAFVEATSRTSCVPAWNGDPTQTVAGGRYLSGIAALRAMGGDVVPSFGGYSADHGGTEIGDSCHSLSDLVAAYKSVITTLDVTRLDMDVEDLSLGPHGCDRPSQQGAPQVEDWARQQRPQAPGRVHAADHAARARGRRAGGAQERQVQRHAGGHRQHHDLRLLRRQDHPHGRRCDQRRQGAARPAAALYPHRTAAALWAMEGNTILPGIDDYPAKTEVTHLPDVKALRAFAKTVGISHAERVGGAA